MNMRSAVLPEALASLKDVEPQTYAKVFWRLLPFFTFSYVIAYLDRVNAGFVTLQMPQQPGLSETVSGFGARLFFPGYFVVETPGNVILHEAGARVWLARLMLTWGLITDASISVNSEISFYAMHFLPGVGEALFNPGMILYLSAWFPSALRAKVNAMFVAGVPLTGILAIRFRGG